MNVPAIDDILCLGPHTYLVLGTRMHTTEKGAAVLLTVIEGLCASCGERFRLSCSRSALERKDQNRRCAGCASPGRRVRVKHEETIRRANIPHAEKVARLNALACWRSTDEGQAVAARDMAKRTGRLRARRKPPRAVVRSLVRRRA